MKLQRKYPHQVHPPELYPYPVQAQEAAKRLLLQLYVPPSVLVDSNGACVGFFGDIQRYLSVARNEENSNLFAVAHERVRGRLKAALKLEWFVDGPVGAKETAPECDDLLDSMTVVVRPVQAAGESFFLVSFLDGQNTWQQENVHTFMVNAALGAAVPETYALLCGGGDKQPASLGLLSPRQRAVLDLVVNGRSNKQIAWDLGISRRTVETHRVIVMRKLGARNLADLMRLVAAA